MKALRHSRSGRFVRLVGVAAAIAAVTRALTGEAPAEANLALQPRPLDRVQPLSELRARSENSTVALVLGGGGLRGFAHIGVLRALEEAGIRPDIVVGTSAGALVGAVYASGATLAEIEQAARELDVADLIDWTLDSRGLMRGENIAQWVETATHGQAIESFPTRFGAVATDLRSGEAVLLDTGRPGDAVRASAAVPGTTVPVPYRGGHLIDGGVSSLVPVRFARALGADLVIAVDVYCTGPAPEGLGAATVVRRTMQAQTCLLAAQELAEADIAIRVDVPSPRLSSSNDWPLTMEAGYQEARASLASAHRRAIGATGSP